MASFNPTRTPVNTESKLGADGDPVFDPTLYRSFASGLQYLTFTRLDISYDVQQGIIYSHGQPSGNTISRSSVEAEYRGVANVVVESALIRNLFRELHMPLSSATLVYCDNISTVYLTANLVQHQRTKHIEIDIHFVRDMVARGHVRALHVPSR
ncbi:ribonuclease H-like domain-containing protein [Tanacetum coccineum]